VVIQLDGDELRDVFKSTKNNSHESHEREVRLSLAMQYASLCQMLSKQGITVVIATISLFKEVHIWNRANIPNYFEVFLKVPLDELRRRDPKNIYKRFDDGQLNNVVGLDIAVDEPENADFVVEFNKHQTVSMIAEKLFFKLQEKRSEN
jgi:cytidine diphosphoramidate kinase